MQSFQLFPGPRRGRLGRFRRCLVARVANGVHWPSAAARGAAKTGCGA